MRRCDTSPVPVAGRSTAPRLLRLWVRIPLPGLHKEISRLWDLNQHSLFPKATASTRLSAWATPADNKNEGSGQFIHP